MIASAIGDIGQEIILRAHHAFRFASGTRSVHDGRQVVGMHRLQSRRQVVCAGHRVRAAARKLSAPADPCAAVLHHDHLLQSRQLPLKVDQAPGNRRILDEGGPALRMAEHFDKHTSERLGARTTLGKPPARVARSAASQGRQFSPMMATVSPGAIPTAHKPNSTWPTMTPKSRQEISSNHSPVCNLINVRSPSSAARWKKIWPTWRPCSRRRRARS